jgi:hypothetical protein
MWLPEAISARCRTVAKTAPNELLQPIRFFKSNWRSDV